MSEMTSAPEEALPGVEDDVDELGEWDVPGLEPDLEPPAPAVSAIKETPELREAQIVAEAAEQAAVDYGDELRSAEDLVADAAGVEAVARARLVEINAKETSVRSEVLAAEEAVAKAARDRGRAELRAERLQERLDAAEAAIDRAYTHVQNLVAQTDQPVADPEDDEEAAKLIYATLPEFVEQFLVPTYRRWIGGVSGRQGNGEDSFWWDAKWWMHPEAVMRLEALWRAFEHLRRDPALGTSVWLRDHADHHMPILLSKFGPFGASRDANDRGEPLPHTPPPPGIYDQPSPQDASPEPSQES